MPANKYALLRYRIIDKCLKNKYRPYPSKDFLREKCEEELYGSISGEYLSVKTIERDLKDMRENEMLGFFAPIKYNRDQKGYYYEDADFDIDKKPLSREETDALSLAAKTLFQFRDTEIFKNFSFAIEKIFEQFNLPVETDEHEDAVIQFESVSFYRGAEFLNLFYKAIQETKSVSFIYKKFSGGDETKRQIQPYLLKEWRNRWYVIGKDVSKNRIQSFGLDRIYSPEILEDTFKKDPGFNPDRYFKHAIGITEAGLSPEKVVLAFSPTQGQYLKTQSLHSSQKVLEDNDEKFVIELTVLLTFELDQIILGYADQVEVLEPAHYREHIQNKLGSGLKSYLD